jgi:hypothetical protein
MPKRRTTTECQHDTLLALLTTFFDGAELDGKNVRHRATDFRDLAAATAAILGGLELDVPAALAKWLKQDEPKVNGKHGARVDLAKVLNGSTGRGKKARVA